MSFSLTRNGRRAAFQISGARGSVWSLAFNGNTPRRIPGGPERLRLVLAADEFLDGDSENDELSDLLVNQLHENYMQEEAPARPASNTFVKSLPRLPGSEAVGRDCSVCLETFDKRDNCVQLPCDHLFHEACVTTWLDQQHSCPTCRFELPERTKEEIEQERTAANRARVEEAWESAAAAAAACCAGSPDAFFDMALLQHQEAQMLDRRPRQARRRGRLGRRTRHLHFSEDAFVERLFGQVSDLQLRSEMETRNRQRRRAMQYAQENDITNPEALRALERIFDHDLEAVPEHGLRALFDAIEVAHVQFETLSELRLIARLFFYEE